jgi:ferrous iron transport protein B
VAHLLWDKAKDFLQRAFTVIFLASIVVWFLKSFDFRLNLVAEAQDSILSVVAGWLAPVFTLHGFADWRIVTALIAGFLAKESVVSTLSVLLGTAAVSAVLSPVSALALLVFCLLYTPCVAAVASVRRELGRTWAAAVVVLQCAVAWVVALIVRGIAILL